MSPQSPSGTLYVVSAPSGAGKTSLVAALTERTHGLMVSVSHTTRAPRPGETDGINYHFVSESDFADLRARDSFLEYARVFDHYYGTSESWVKEQLEQGTDVVLEIDWQGARQVRDRLPSACGIFVLPPSIDVLRERLSRRGQDSKEVVERRMRDATSEASHCAEFDYIVVNEQFGRALSDMEAIVQGNRLRREQQMIRHRGLVEELCGTTD